MKKLLLALLVVSATTNIFADSDSDLGFGEENLRAHDSYRSIVNNTGKMSSKEAQGHWDSFKSRIKKAKPVQTAKTKQAAKTTKSANAA